MSEDSANLVHAGTIISTVFFYGDEINVPQWVLWEWFEDWCTEHHRRLEEREALSAVLDKAGWTRVDENTLCEKRG